ncbi:MAG: hypothetical protein A3F42_06140 [Gammaproteobacteria bacterium RIFCSPHIGHO2_12_FULL_37_34]|nr:MAG: hypothetical protein A3F42_06140 [Gammaproteobacteria bacterium RIFCSPHIGHO2_12_FULL_37_34]
MFNENFEQWYKNKNLFTPTNEWGKQVTELCHICQHMAQKNLEMTNENVFRWSDQFKRLTNIKKPEELLNLQRDFINENMSACMQGMQTLMSTCAEGMDEYMKLCKPTNTFGGARDSSATRSYEKPEKSSSK